MKILRKLTENEKLFLERLEQPSVELSNWGAKNIFYPGFVWSITLLVVAITFRDCERIIDYILSGGLALIGIGAIVLNSAPIFFNKYSQNEKLTEYPDLPDLNLNIDETRKFLIHRYKLFSDILYLSGAISYIWPILDSDKDAFDIVFFCLFITLVLVFSINLAYKNYLVSDDNCDLKIAPSRNIVDTLNKNIQSSIVVHNEVEEFINNEAR